MYYINGDKNQFCFSKDKIFIGRYTLPNFIYYKNSEFSDIKNYPSDKRLKLIEEVLSNENIDLELKNKIIHCVLCAKWYPINNSYRYCYDCEYNPDRYNYENKG